MEDKIVEKIAERSYEKGYKDAFNKVIAIIKSKMKEVEGLSPICDLSLKEILSELSIQDLKGEIER